MTDKHTGGTRDKILDTAREQFSAYSYRAASMRQIAEQVGITKPSLYHHFRNKSEILSSLLEPPIAQLDAALNAAGAETDPAKARRLLLEGCVDAMLAHRETLVLLLRDASVYGDEGTGAMSRMLSLVERATALLVGPDPDWKQRVRAAQAFAAATDPIGQFNDIPDDELRVELLRGAEAILAVGDS